MRFLLSIYKYFPTGGLQKDALRIALKACERGHDLLFLTTSWEGSRPDNPHLEIKLLPAPHACGNLSKMREFSQMVARERDENQCDAEIAMNRIPGADLYFAGDECMKRLLPRKHCALVRTLLPRYRAILHQERKTVLDPKCRKILLISKRQQRDFQEEYPELPPERTMLLPPGLDEGSLPPGSIQEKERIRTDERLSLGISDDEVMLLMVSSGFAVKGVDRALDAIASLPEEARSRIRLVLVGRNDPVKFACMAQKAGIAPAKAIALPPRDSVGGLYLAADLLLHPARSEGAGSVLLEALANGLPVLCTQVCGFANYIEEAGFQTIPEPFSQKRLDELLAEMLGKLDEHKKTAQIYGERCDFCRRADAIVDQLEETARTTRKLRGTYEEFQTGKWHGFIFPPKPKIPLERLDQWIDENDANNARQGVTMRRITRIDQPNGDPPWYLKVLWGLGDNRQTLTQALKWRFLPSRAIHIFKISQTMEECGFLVPEILLAARKRPWRPWGMPTDILVTRAAEGRLVSDALCKGNEGPILEGVARQELIGQTARELARLHKAGFVHGDCHPGNIFFVDGREAFCYIDNDRTQKYPRFNLRGAATNMASMGFYLLKNNGLRSSNQEWNNLLDSYLNELKLPPKREDKFKRTLAGKLKSRLKKPG